jgi:hypothetical protein
VESGEVFIGSQSMGLNEITMNAVPNEFPWDKKGNPPEWKVFHAKGM